MILTRRFLIVAIIIPILGLAILTGHKASVLNFGRDMTFPIEGYDPRDLLSGHYLIYRILYGVPDVCVDTPQSGPRLLQENAEGFICASSKSFSFSPPESCDFLIRGTCEGTRFVAGLEKFFIPEGRAKELEKAVIEKRGSVVISTTQSGDAQVKELRIDGKPWR